MLQHWMRAVLVWVLSSGVAAGLLGGCVTEGAFLRLQERLERTEKTAVKTQKEVGGVRADAEKAVETLQKDQADIKADMIDLHSEIQELRGQVTSDLHSTSQENKEREAMEETVVMQLSHVQEQVQSLEERVVRIEEFFGLRKTSTSSGAENRPPAPKVVPAPTPPVPANRDEGQGGSGERRETDLSPEEAYEMAYRLYKSGRYENARTAFEAFVNRYPGSSLVENALFWIGQTYYNTGDYENAIVKYQVVREKFPKGAKAPDALLKMGLSLEKMGEAEAAVAALKKLLKEYPSSSQADLAQRKIRQLTPTETEPRKDRGNEAKEKPKEPVANEEPLEKEAPAKNPS